MNTIPVQTCAGSPEAEAQAFFPRLQRQATAIVGLTLHAMRAQSKKGKLGYFWELSDPIIQVAVWFVLFAIMRGPRTIYDMSTFLFLGTGIIGLFFFLKIAQDLPRFVRQNQAFLGLPVVTQVDLFLAGFLQEAIVMAVVAAVVWSAIVLTSLGFAPADPLGVIWSCACLSLLGLGFGAFNAMALVLVPLYDKVLNILYRLLFLLSGAIFPLAALPLDVQRYLVWNPVTQGLEQLRSAWSYTFDSTITSNWYVLLWAGGLFLMALLLDHHSQRATVKT